MKWRGHFHTDLNDPGGKKHNSQGRAKKWNLPKGALKLVEFKEQIKDRKMEKAHC